MNCFFCGTGETRKVMEMVPSHEYGFSITKPFYGRGQNLYRCKECGVTFAFPFPNEKELQKAYTELEDPSYLEEIGRSGGAIGALSSLERFSGRRGKLLDVGCFCGAFLLEAKAVGWDIEGVEPSAWAREKAREKFGLSIRHAALAEARFPEESFDVVTIIDVLEHFLDPKKEIQEIHRVLKKGGLLYLSTPDVGSLTAKIFRKKWWGYRQEHLFYFTRPALRRFLASSGFDRVWEGFYGRTFTIGQLLWRLQGISRKAHRLLSGLTKVFWIRDWEIPVNLRDRIAMIVRKR